MLPINRLIKLKEFIFLALFYGLICSPRVQAMPEDTQAKLILSANTADLNQANHQGEYVGDVKLDQGTSHLRAHRAVTIVNDKNRLIEAIAYSRPHVPVHFWTKIAADKPDLHAYADEMHYYPEKHMIELIGHAKVTQDKNVFSAPKIIYDTKTQHVVSKRDRNDRTVIIIYPEKIS